MHAWHPCNRRGTCRCGRRRSCCSGRCPGQRRGHLRQPPAALPPPRSHQHGRRQCRGDRFRGPQQRQRQRQCRGGGPGRRLRPGSGSGHRQRLCKRHAAALLLVWRQPGAAPERDGGGGRARAGGQPLVRRQPPGIWLRPRRVGGARRGEACEGACCAACCAAGAEAESPGPPACWCPVAGAVRSGSHALSPDGPALPSPPSPPRRPAWTCPRPPLATCSPSS